MTRRIITSTARNARRHPVRALLGALVIAAATAAIAVAAGGKPDFSLAASPSAQTVTKPASGSAAVTYSLSIGRVNGMTDPVALSLSGVPSGVNASLVPSTVAATSNAATLTLSVTPAAAVGTSTVTITGVGKNASQTHTTTVALTVQQPTAAADFTIVGSPATQTITQGDLATVNVGIGRVNGFAGTVTLAQTGAPTPANITFTPQPVPTSGSTSTLTIDTDPSIATGTYTVSITGTSGTLSHTAKVTLVVQKGTPQHFDISGGARHAVGIGNPSPIDLSLHNATNQTIRVTGITVSVEQATSASACPGTTFAVTQLAQSAYSKLVLAPGQTKTLTALGVTDAEEPQLSIVDTGQNEDPCKNGTVYLDYSGTATK